MIVQSIDRVVSNIIMRGICSNVQASLHKNVARKPSFGSTMWKLMCFQVAQTKFSCPEEGLGAGFRV